MGSGAKPLKILLSRLFSAPKRDNYAAIVCLRVTDDRSCENAKKNLYSVLFWAPLSHRMIHAVDFSSLSKFKRSHNRVDFSVFLWYA